MKEETSRQPVALQMTALSSGVQGTQSLARHGDARAAAGAQTVAARESARACSVLLSDYMPYHSTSSSMLRCPMWR